MVEVDDEVRGDAAFGAFIVEGGQQLGCKETCGSGGDGNEDDFLAKVGEFDAEWRDEGKILQRLMNTFPSLFFSLT